MGKTQVPAPAPGAVPPPKGGGIIGSVQSLLKNIGKLIRFTASALVGIPLAIAGTLIGLIALGIVDVAAALNAKAIKSFFGTEIVQDAVLESYKKDIKSLIAGLWTGFGAYAFLETADTIREASEEFLDSTGQGQPLNSIENMIEIGKSPADQIMLQDNKQLMQEIKQDIKSLGKQLKDIQNDLPDDEKIKMKSGMKKYLDGFGVELKQRKNQNPSTSLRQPIKTKPIGNDRGTPPIEVS
jgi:hypothetical protein